MSNGEMTEWDMCTFKMRTQWLNCFNKKQMYIWYFECIAIYLSYLIGFNLFLESVTILKLK